MMNIDTQKMQLLEELQLSKHNRLAEKASEIIENYFEHNRVA